MKQKIIRLFVLLSLLLSMTACHTTPKSEKLQILCTGFSQYDWVRQVLGNQLENTQLTLLANNSADLHSYQATVADLAKISDCDLFIYIGGPSDAWAKEALKNPRNSKRQVLALIDFAKKDDAEEHEHHDHEQDEHIWLSLNYAQKAVTHIAVLLGEIDPPNSALYRENADKYNQSLQQLDQRYRQCIASAKHRTLLFADRFPFYYMTEDYGLNYHAAFNGCSSETEASFSTIISLAEQIDKQQLTSVLVVESSDQVIANAVIDNTNSQDQTVLIMDSIQAGSQQRIANGETYLSIMKKNLTVLQQALN